MFADPFTIFGVMSIPLLVSNILTVIFFLLSSIFALIYTMKFYEGRRKPKRWLSLISGLLLICFSEFGQFLIPYMIEPTPNIFKAILYSQNLGIILITIGCFMLYRGAKK